MSLRKVFRAVYEDAQTSFKFTEGHTGQLSKLSDFLNDLKQDECFDAEFSYESGCDFGLLKISDGKVSETFYVAMTSNPVMQAATLSLYSYDATYNKKDVRLGMSKNENDFYTPHGYDLNNLDDADEFFSMIAKVIGKKRAKYDYDQQDIRHNPRYD